MKKPERFSVGPDGSRTLAYVVAPEDSGLTLVECLGRAFPSYRMEDWLEAAQSHALTLDSAPVSADAVLFPGMRVEYHVPKQQEPPVDDRYGVVFEDEHLAVVNKSGNMPCHPAGRYYENSLVRRLVAHQGFAEAYLVNRIDRETSGLVLVAKTQDAASRCGRSLMSGHMGKSYLVLVMGDWTHRDASYEVRGVLGLERGDVVRKKYVFRMEGESAGQGGQYAETHFRLVWNTEGISLLEAKPITGRPHQIRATLKAIGYPVVGDKLYGVDETIYARMSADAITPADAAALRMNRQALHSWRLEFRHPFSRRDLSFEAPPPPDEPLWNYEGSCESPQRQAGFPSTPHPQR